MLPAHTVIHSPPTHTPDPTLPSQGEITYTHLFIYLVCLFICVPLLLHILLPSLPPPPQKNPPLEL